METPPRAWVKNAEELRAELSKREVDEATAIKKRLKELGSEGVDARVAAIGPKVEAAIDCTQCAACCKVLEPELSQADLGRLPAIEGLGLVEFARTRTESSNSGKVFLKAGPCAHLKGGSCSIYAQRPESCADFPHLYRPHFMYRRLIWEHYTLCPIVFNVVQCIIEELNGKLEGETDFGNLSPSA